MVAEAGPESAQMLSREQLEGRVKAILEKEVPIDERWGVNVKLVYWKLIGRTTSVLVNEL